MIFVGSFFSSATNSATVLTPSDAGTTSALGSVVSIVTGAMSFSGSYGSFENRLTLIASGPPSEMPMVVPSGCGFRDHVGAGVAARAGAVVDRSR